MIKKQALERLYAHYNHRRWVHPDPLEFLYHYPDPAEREVAGLVASGLAYGRVGQILKSVSYVLDKMGPSPRMFLLESRDGDLHRTFSGFKHRFTTGGELAVFLTGIRGVLRSYGSLQEGFMAGYSPKDETVLPALEDFAALLSAAFGGARNSLLPRPARGSACKRLHLYLRWMVRKDGVDPGGWEGVDPSKLIIPLDTHMHRICKGLGLTARRCADRKTALESTRGFRTVAPRDPVRYDFALTRLGIRKDQGLEKILGEGFPCRAAPGGAET
ncbi:MAG: TIGR02757 family protein [Deltaproteobacteria bacterium]|nr:TIGR02757 family protein [Deltaproteobacteria bacterium]MBW1922361.1 TIGR02757 family protein [Deltaproteobacteria bacterium]MBW1948113.1 TIGR02757 family protein [Deltaproteobacteria bacterium]MBW2006538.1 TIGR02757 family protein [Deltaproteobacteria bacterium]MBW2346414.1 TIGR02757 family protein [Deltaproteobacteria bacterium]